MSDSEDASRREWALWYLQVAGFGLGMLGWFVAGFGSLVVSESETMTVVAAGFGLSGFGFVGMAALAHLQTGDVAKPVGFGTFGVGNALAGLAAASAGRAQFLTGAAAAVVAFVGWITVKAETLPLVDV